MKCDRCAAGAWRVFKDSQVGRGQTQSSLGENGRERGLKREPYPRYLVPLVIKVDVTDRCFLQCLLRLSSRPERHENFVLQKIYGAEWRDPEEVSSAMPLQGVLPRLKNGTGWR